MNDKLNEMWTALSAYQTRAVAAGHGESWALMCSERTERAAYAAAHVAWDADASYAAWAAEAAAYAATNVEHYADRSIAYITKAQEETK
jgi:hypothetical protein